MTDFIIERFHEEPPPPKRYRRKAQVRAFTDPQLCTGYSWIRANESNPEYEQQCRLWRFAFGTGLREGEIVHQRKHDTLVETDTGITISVEAEWSKTGRPRVTPCTPELVPFLSLWLSGMVEGEYLFHKENGTPYDPRTLQRWYNEICEAMGMPRDERGRFLGGMHATRHTYATQELLSGRLTLPQVSEFLGHSKYDTTVKYYIHCFAETAYSGPIKPAWRAVALCQDKPALRIAG